MRTLITSLALAACAATFAQGTQGITNTTDPAKAGTDQQPAPYVKSAYDECLTNAGTNTWQVLGLNEDQIARITAMQTRYKQAAKTDADEKVKAAAKAEKEARKHGRSKKNNGVADKTTTPPQKPSVPATAQPATANTDQRANGNLEKKANDTTAMKLDKEAVVPAEKDNTALEPAKDERATLDKDLDASASAMGDTPMISASPYDDELRSILTPEQLQQWVRRCNVDTSMRP